MRKNKEEKYTLTIRMDSKTEQGIREKMDDAHVRSLNAFVLKAIEFYLGYLKQGKNLNYVSPILASSIKGEMKNIEHNLSEIIFKAAVQLSIRDLDRLHKAGFTIFGIPSPPTLLQAEWTQKPCRESSGIRMQVLRLTLIPMLQLICKREHPT